MALRCRPSLLAVLVSVLLPVSATWSYADPIQWSGNQHWYDGVPGTFSWQEANEAAQSMSWMGLPGHLATLTSAGEDQFVSSQFSGQQGFTWLGGYQDPQDEPDPAANWHWVTGEPWLFTDWEPGEPNDYGGVPEFCLDYSAYGSRWNDEPDRPMTGFVVEFEQPATPVATTTWSQVKALFR